MCTDLGGVHRNRLWILSSPPSTSLGANVSMMIILAAPPKLMRDEREKSSSSREFERERETYINNISSNIDLRLTKFDEQNLPRSFTSSSLISSLYTVGSRVTKINTYRVVLVVVLSHRAKNITNLL